MINNWKYLFKVTLVLIVVLNLALGTINLLDLNNQAVLFAASSQVNRGVLLDTNLLPIVVNKPLFALKRVGNTNPSGITKLGKDYWYFSNYSSALNAKQELGSSDEIILFDARDYLYSNSLASLTGYEYSLDNNFASVGLENKLNNILAANQNVSLTINKDWNLSLYKNLQAQVSNSGAEFGAASIINTSTGEIMAYTSYPSFDPNQFAVGITNNELNAYLQETSKPLLDKMVSISSVPGSIYKLASTLSMFKNGKVPLDFKTFSNGCIYLGDSPFCEYAKRYLGELDLSTALTTSSNTFFCLALQEYLKENSIESYLNEMKDLGLGEGKDYDWSQTNAGVLPSPEYKKLNYKENWYLGDSCNTVIGQGMVLVTPMQMLQVVAAIANNGKVMQPHVVKATYSQQGTLLSKTEPQMLKDLNVDPALLQIVKEGMYRVTHDSRGTDYWVLGFAPIDVWAKTGTAEAIRNVNGELIPDVNGWVIGYFNFESETYAFVVQLQYGKGGWNATPVIKGFLDCLVTGFPNECK